MAIPNAKGMRRFTQLILLTGLTLVGQHVQAQSTQTEWWPEIDAFVGLNSESRLKFVTARATDGITYDSADIGAALEITLKPILRRNEDSLD
jgi:hypothetical protein